MGRVGFRRQWRKRSRSRRRKRWRQVCAPLIVAGLLASLVFARCCPVLVAFAESEAVWVATKAANRIVASVLEEYAELCHSLVETRYNQQQVLASVQMDTASVNTVRTAITTSVMAELEQYATLSVRIPLGTLAGLDWLSGWGPLFTFPIGITPTVLSDVTTSLDEVGINQSRFCVEVQVKISLYIVTPGGRSTVHTEQSYPMAEAVLLGEVPDNFTEVYGDEQDLLGKIFDYGTSK